MKSSKQGSALILVLLVFTLLFTMVTVGLMMVNFSVLATTRQANLKQAQLTARSDANTLAKYLSLNPAKVVELINKTTSLETMSAMGDYTVDVSSLCGMYITICLATS